MNDKPKSVEEIAKFYNYPLADIKECADFMQKKFDEEIDKQIFDSGDFPIKGGKIIGIHFEETAENIANNEVTVHVDQEVSTSEIFDALIPYFKSFNFATREIEILLPAHFKINLPEIMKWFCTGITMTDTTDDILNKDQTKIFRGTLISPNIFELLYEKFNKYNDTSISAC